MTAPRRRRPWVAAAVLLLVAVTATGCIHAPAPPSPAPSAIGHTPAPPGIVTTDGRGPQTPEPSCPTFRTLRPGPLPAPNAMPAGTSLRRIQEQGRLVVGLDLGSNLFSFRDPRTGRITGFDVDIASEIAKRIFGTPSVDYRLLTSNERIQALKEHSVDIVVKTMSITCSRATEVSFSAPYYRASQRILAVRGSTIRSATDLGGKRVCIARGTTSLARVQRVAPTAVINVAATWADCLVSLQQGQSDAVSTDDAILAGLAAQDPIYLEVIGDSLGEELYGVGIPLGDEALVRFVNGVLEQIKNDGTWYRIYDAWLQPLGAATPPTAVYQD